MGGQNTQADRHAPNPDRHFLPAPAKVPRLLGFPLDGLVGISSRGIHGVAMEMGLRRSLGAALLWGGGRTPTALQPFPLAVLGDRRDLGTSFLPQGSHPETGQGSVVVTKAKALH